MLVPSLDRAARPPPIFVDSVSSTSLSSSSASSSSSSDGDCDPSGADSSQFLVVSPLMAVGDSEPISPSSPATATMTTNSSKSVTFDGDTGRRTYDATRSSLTRPARDPYTDSLNHHHHHAAGGSSSATSTSAGTSSAKPAGSIPLPSPSAVHINNALEESLRRAEEERQRRSFERRLLRRKLRRREYNNNNNNNSATTPTIAERDVLIEEDEEGTAAGIHLPPHPPEQAILDSADEVGSNEDDYDDNEDDYSDDSEEDERNLTRQLAETAVSVREMSRELGRARVKSSIQSVLIVTKARDNQLIRLTRELALYLMKTPRHGRSRGITVYVDAQLRKSKRFDAAGIERENPELFRSDRHHHHHSHTGTGGSHQRRNSRKSSTSASSLNILGMAGASSDRLSASVASSGASTPALANAHSGALSNGKPLTRLTEALVSRQLDRQLEKEKARRSGTSLNQQAYKDAAEGQSGVNTPLSPASAVNGEEQGLLRYWTAEMCSKSPHLFDLVVTLGGDGTVLFTSWLFQHVVPPVIPFALGSLGFLTNFDFSNHVRVMESAINDGVRVNLRMRFTATIYRAVNQDDVDGRRRAIRSGETGQIFMEKLKSGGWDAIESGGAHAQQGQQNSSPYNSARDREVTCSVTRPAESFEVLNDLVVDRGPSPYVSLLELFGDEHHMTTVQADGLCVATPTGSTAYSLSAGGSLVHPEIPTLLITPICPHTLSFRPMLLPDSMELRICVPYNSRSTAWASFDGRGRVEIRQGDHIKVTASQYPFPTVCADKQSTDWFQAIQRTLKWNERQRQKSFVVVEQAREDPQDTSAKGVAAVAKPAGKSDPVASLKGKAEDDEDDGSFDIDDIPMPGSSTSTSAPSPSSNERQSGAPIIGTSSAAIAQEANDNADAELDTEHHHDPRHLRQYDIPMRNEGKQRSPRLRTPNNPTHPPLPRHGNERTPTSRDRRGTASAREGDKVKAFVVFGADSSDAETTASEDN